jgi:arylsulfatase A-like enzyme
LVPKEEDFKVLEELYNNSSFPGKNENLKKSLVPYLAMIRNIDTNVGDLLSFLEEKGERENTIIVFLTDNGSIMGINYFNAGMRGMKTELWDGGHRVPCFINWPKGNFKNIGKEVSGLAQVQDILPTLVDLCDLKKPTPLSFDGMSLAPVLRGEEEIPEDRMLIINYSRMPNFINYPDTAWSNYR